MAPAAVFTAAWIGAAVSGVSAAITGGNVGKGMLLGGVIGGATAGIGSVISGGAAAAEGGAAGAASGGASGGAAGTTAGGAALGNIGNIGAQQAAGQGIVGISANVPANSPQVFGNMKSAGLLGGSSGGTSAAGSIAGNMVEQSVADKVARGGSNLGTAGDAVGGQGRTIGEQGRTIGEQASQAVSDEQSVMGRVGDWWNSQSDVAQGNYMKVGGDLVSGVGKGLLGGMNAEEEREWEEKMYERMRRDRQIRPLNIDGAPPTPRIASGYSAYPAWVQEKLRRSQG